MDVLAAAKKIGDRVPERTRPWAVFLVSLALIAPTQWFISWNGQYLLDGKFWVPAVDQASQWVFPEPGTFTYGYPGMTFLLPAAGIMEGFDTSAEFAHRATMALLVTLAGAAAAVLAYTLRPRSLWWLFVIWLYMFHSQFSQATPPAGLITAFMPPFMLLILLAIKERPSIVQLGAIGAAGGVLLATRIDSAIPILGVMTLFLATKRFAALYVIPLAATNVFLLLDPSLWIESPVAHLANTFEKILYHGEFSEHGMLPPLDMMFVAGKFGIFAFALAAILFVSGKLKALPKAYFLWTAFMVAAACTGLSLIHHHPSWMYSPFLIVFEIFLPLLALDAYDALPEEGSFKKMKPEGALLRIIAPIYLALTALAYYVDVARVY